MILLASRDLGILTLKELLGRNDIVEVVAVVPGDEEFLKFATSVYQNVLKVDDVNSDSFISSVRELQADVLINVIFLQKYREKLLSVPKFGALNVHPSLLPFYRGRDCIRWAMINGEKMTGVTIHQMDAGLDTGEILAQESFPIESDDTYFDVRERMKPYYPKIVMRAIRALDDEIEKRTKQNPVYEGNYFPHITPEDTRIDWNERSVDIHNLIRACFEPGFYAHTILNGKKLYVTGSKLRPSNEYRELKFGRALRCGRVLDYDKQDPIKSSLLVGTADGVISVANCTFDLKGQPQKAREILRRGDKLG